MPLLHGPGVGVAAAMAWQPVATLAFLLLARGGSETATFHGSDAQPLGGVTEG